MFRIIADNLPLILELIIICPIIVWLLYDFYSIWRSCTENFDETNALLQELRKESETLQSFSDQYVSGPKSFDRTANERAVLQKLNLPPQFGEFSATKAKAQSLVFIGLIGTVIGIAISTILLAFGVTNANGKTEVVVAEMSRMLTTLPIAFVVTFVAVFLSVIANRKTHAVIALQNALEELCAQNNNVRQHIVESRAQDETHRLLIQMSKLIDPNRDLSTLTESIDIVKNAAISLSSQQRTLIGVVRDLAPPMREASDGLTAFGKSLDTSVDKLLPAAEKVAATMSSVRETTGVIDKAYDKLFGVSDRLENVAAYLVSDAFRASSQVIGEMTQRQNQFLTKMDLSLDAQLQLIQQSIGQQQALQSNFMQLIAAYESMQRDQVPAITELKVALQAQSILSTALTDQASTVADSTKKLSESVDQGNAKLKETMSSSNSTMVTMVSTLNTMLERLNAIPFWPNWPGSKSGNGRGR